MKSIAQLLGMHGGTVPAAPSEDASADKDYVYIGSAVTFDQADLVVDIEEQVEELRSLCDIYQQIASNIFYANREAATPDTLRAQLATATEELLRRIRDDLTGTTGKIATVPIPDNGNGKVERFAAAPAGLTIQKDANGDWRWLALYTNHYEDRDREIIAADAHKEYEGYVDKSGDYPELWVWHVPGSRIGVADVIAFDAGAGFQIASGTFDDPAYAETLKSWPADDPLGCSHGFTFNTTDFHDGVYYRYRDREVSVLPVSRAANPLTTISIEEAIIMNDEKKAVLGRLFGDEKVEQMAATMASLGEKARAQGLTYKDVGDALVDAMAPASTATNAADTTPSATPPAGAGTTAVPGDTTDATLGATIAAAITSAMAPVLDQLNAMGGEIKALKSTDADKLAALIAPRAQPAAAKAATQSADNIVSIGDPAVRAALEAAKGGNGALPDVADWQQDDMRQLRAILNTPANVGAGAAG